MIIKGFKEFSLSKAGILSLETDFCWGAYFQLDSDIQSAFPYLNRTIQRARYVQKPVYMQFLYLDRYTTLYPREVLAAPFSNKEDALAFFENLSGFINEVFENRDQIEPNHKTFCPVSVIDVLKLVPRTNCRACGYPTCMAFAAALRQDKTTPNRCPDFRKPITTHAVYPIHDPNGMLISTVTIEIDTDQHPSTPRQINRSAGNEDAMKAPASNSAASSSDEMIVELPFLTDREIQVLRLVSKGETNNAIAGILSISPHTVKSHVIHIFNKLGVGDRTRASVFAIRYGLI
ncbi:MAG: hypothetical protein HY881_28515 [Deltaproteobacteria bacterium]|nr:hypothetical protein [Deltaproteobacteria bacterium]